jgi:two-component sensor histidine kinase
MQANTLGMRIVQSLARRLDGSFTLSGEVGMVARLEFPA